MLPPMSVLTSAIAAPNLSALEIIETLVLRMKICKTDEFVVT